VEHGDRSQRGVLLFHVEQCLCPVSRFEVMSRRKFLKNLAFVGGTWPSMISSMASAGVEPEEIDGMAGAGLIAALRETGKPVCGQAAERLKAQGFPASGFNLHLRGADLTASDALAISKALDLLRAQKASPMRSFSISYNEGIGDASVVALVNAFPASLVEIGMVGCDLGDESGEALLQFTREASNLKMICIEDNRFSPQLRQRFKALGDARRGLLLVG
jgi:hypothetical protein